MAEFDRIYRLTAIRAPEAIAVAGFDRSFFEEVETVTVITDLDITFKIEKSRERQPNRCDITIINLAAAMREELTSGKTIIRLEAGYDATLRPMFVGDLRYANNRLEGTEWRTELQIGDGARAYSEARINRSYAPKTAVSTVLADLSKALGLPPPSEAIGIDALGADLRSRLAAGEVVSGYASDELTRILAPYGYEWSIQNGRLQLERADRARPGSIREISEDTGMLGSPSIDPPKITATKSKKAKVPKLTVRHLLYPEVTPGEQLEIRSRSINGTFRADVVSHEGDTRGTDWTTTIEATEV